MWSYEYEAATPATPAEVWTVLADLPTWPDWDTSMEWIRLDGPLEVGATVTMKPLGQDPIDSVVQVVDPDRCYGDSTQFAGVELRFRHTLHAVPKGTRVVHRLEVIGDDDVAAEVGPAVTEDFPQAMQGLLAAAVRRSGATPTTPATA